MKSGRDSDGHPWTVSSSRSVRARQADSIDTEEVTGSNPVSSTTENPVWLARRGSFMCLSPDLPSEITSTRIERMIDS